jgi:nucleoporin NUP82
LSQIEGSELPQLLLFDTVQLPGIIKDRPCFPSFVRNVISPFTFFVTHNAGVCSISLSSSIRKLIAEFNSPTEAGAGVRFEVLLEGEKSQVDFLINIVEEHPDFFHEYIPDLAVETCVVFEDSDLPGFLLTACHGHPFAACLEIPIDSDGVNVFDDENEAVEHKLHVPAESRPTYRPPEVFEKPSVLEAQLESAIPQRHRRIRKEPIIFSPAVLELITQCHLILSQETHLRQLAASDLFRRCERDRDEFHDQIKRVRELSDKVAEITGDDEEPESGEEDSEQADEERLVGAAKLQKRLEDAGLRQKDLVKRYHGLFQKLERLQVRELTEQERAWAEELKRMDQATGEGEVVEDKGASMPPWRRIQEARSVKDELLSSAAAVTKEGESRGDSPHRVPAEYRKAKVAHVNELLERETALVEATAARLSRLNMET